MSKTNLEEIVNQLTKEQQQSLAEIVIRRRTQQLEPSDIAIIGLSGRYPQADNHYDFWNKIQQGTNFIQDVPASRWDHSDYYDPQVNKSFVPHKTRCKFGAFINACDQFDASFFDLHPDEVQRMDPQERLALETSWSCIEDAGYIPSKLDKEVGIFSGVTYGEYQKIIPITTHFCMLNNRIAYFFNFQGPTVTTDGGCSSSLTAIHLACQSLVRKECQTAIVIGANIILHPDHYTSLSSGLSPTTQPCSNPFGTDDGWIPAEGVVSILLKPLQQALQSQDHIYAVIKSSHISQEGKTSWFTAFNPKQQAVLIHDNFKKSGIHPETISYVEAAANGSSLGDAIELEGLITAFNRFTNKKQFCPIGSVKSNVGHGEAVSTLLQLTKVLLQFKSKTIIPLINLKEKNPNISLGDSPFYFGTSIQKWEPPTLKLNGKQFTIPRRATISSYGAGGNIGHLILEEHVPEHKKTQTPGSYFIPISSQTADQLRETVKNYIGFFKEYQSFDWEWKANYTLLNIMFTLCVGRVPFQERVVFIVKNFETLIEKFHQFLNGENDPDIISKAKAGTIVTTTENSREQVQHFIEHHLWNDLAESWVRGIDISWETFFNPYNVQRIPLPTYCFQRQSFPIPKPSHPNQSAKDDSIAKTAAVVENHPDNTSNKNKSYPAKVTTTAPHPVRTKKEPSFFDIETDTQIIKMFRGIFAKATNIPASQIDLSTPLDKYGFDSAMVVTIANELEPYFSTVPKTLFFECQNIRDVINYFINEYPDEIREIIQKSENKNGKVGSIPGEAGVNPGYQIKNLHESTSSQSSRSKDIAIIGLAGRYPQAKNMDEFWQNLKEGKDSISEIPPGRWRWQDYFHPDRQEASRQGKSYSKWGGFIDDIDQFDPLFFNISPREAETMDPQERLFLEVAWEALEDAGYGITSLNKTNRQNIKVGVFVGVTWDEYQFFSGISNNSKEPVVSTNTSNIANRVSYFCDFKGSSLTVNTACSSSLTAIHLACASLIQGTDTMAIAGGVNISIHPKKYLFLSNYQYVSSKGRCESFGQGGEGYVPGEGVGCVLLKPLQQAIDDEDHIYGVIKGTAINHGGKTNGYTVPNPNAQASVIGQAFKEAGISPRTISYIEAHGTGTSLGDPIEIAGLTKAFQEYTEDRQFCAIGSVKSNIGHGESAAGVAGVTKVLLQLKHRQLVPSLHSKKLNPNINFSQTPFVVQQELAEWKPPKVKNNGKTREFPRRAGISSFGAGGANAHVVIEEYIPGPSGSVNQQVSNSAGRGQAPVKPHLIILSAKNEEQLQEQVQRLLAAILEQQYPDTSLADMAYTLQVGREAMEERLAVMVRSIKELREKLEGFRAGQDIENLYRGQVKRNIDTLAVLTADEDLKKGIDAWIAKGKYAKLLDLWVKGLAFDWNKLYGGSKPRRISLPTYPFAREHCWIPKDNEQGTGDRGREIGGGVGIIHPLLHQNTADLSEQRFSSTFTGQEFFLADHVVMGQHILPGVAYLEMARAALEQAARVPEQGQAGIKLKNVVWARPIAVGDQPVRVHIGLFPEDNGEIAYEIYSKSKEVDAEPVVHSQGTAVLSPAAETPTLDIKALQADCSQTSLSSRQCYEAFRAMRIDYGPGHQGIDTVYVGEGQVLAKLSLPASVSDTGYQFLMHPSLMDSALQASIVLIMGPGDSMSSGSTMPLKPILPFALQELEVFGNCTPRMWARVQYSNGSKPGDKVQKLDIDLCDDQGTIRVRMKGFSSRVLEGEMSPDHTASSAAFGTLMFQPYWKEQVIAQETAAPDYAQHLVILCEPGKRWKIGSKDAGFKMINLQSKQKGIEERFQIYATQVLAEIQSILKNKPRGKVLIQVVVSTQGEQRLFSGLSGLLKTAHLENPKLIGQLIEAGPGEAPDKITEKLVENSRSPMDNRIRYQEGKRWVADWSEVENSMKEVTLPWKDQGIYLLTGGAGGLGLIFAKEIAQQARETTLILTGRSPLDQDRQAKLKELQALGARTQYRQVDVTQKPAVVNLIQSIRKEFGSLHGIIHAAGVIKDNFILKKTKDELLEVLAPKVTGVVNLDQASKDLPIDFFILFSSRAGAMGNIGQADYAAANAFMDAYAGYRSSLAASKQRQGQTLSINWPLWKEGGMHVDEETEKMMKQDTGMIAMQTSSGIQALYQSLTSGKYQVMVMEGNMVQLRHSIGFGSSPQEIKKPKVKASVPDDSLKVQTLNFVKQILANAIKLYPERIQPETPFEKYGIDSILQLNLIRELEKVYGELSKTLLFEYSTTQELVDYLVKNHSERPLESTKLEKNGASKQETSIHQGTPNFKLSSSHKQHRFMRLRGADHISTKQEGEGEDIAIIGISGCYPRSNSLEELWEHLISAHNCITEVPKNRWRTSLRQALSGDEGQQPDKSYYGGFLEHIDQFDHYLFEIPQDQVLELPPELRLFLEIVWETFEDAGYTRLALQELQTRYQRGVGVFVGTMYNQYSWSIPSLEQAVLSSNATDWQIANRTSHFFNLTGPSIAVNSACSSSLTAIHLACESLKQQSCSMAIAGGVNLTLDPSKYDSLQRIKFLDSGNQSKSFGTGDGYIPGEGVGAVLLKPLSKAIQDHDRIDAVIKSSFVNHSGGRQVYTAPDPKQQGQLIANSIQRSGIDPETIGYVESAANGSELGDAIEVIALNNAFKQYTGKKQYCALGSVKSNLGHLEAASGISQLSKVLLQLKHQTLVPSINASPRNPNIKIQDTAFYLQEETRPWSQFKDSRTGNNLPRRSMINSFGAGGAYANLIVEEFIRETALKEPNIPSPQEFIFIFSAKTEWSLIKYLEKMQDFLEENTFIKIGDVARSLQKINHNLEYRAAIIASSIQDLLEKQTLLQEARTSLVDSGIYTSFNGKYNTNSSTPSIIRQALEKNDLRQLAQHWAAGAAIEFGQFHEDQEMPSIALPKYAFEHNIEFNFHHDNSMPYDELAEFDDEFYLSLLEKLSKGELSKDKALQFIQKLEM